MRLAQHTILAPRCLCKCLLIARCVWKRYCTAICAVVHPVCDLFNTSRKYVRSAPPPVLAGSANSISRKIPCHMISTMLVTMSAFVYIDVYVMSSANRVHITTLLCIVYLPSSASAYAKRLLKVVGTCSSADNNCRDTLLVLLLLLQLLFHD